MLKKDGKKETRTMQIVPKHGDPSVGTISQYTVIGRALLGACKGEEIECTPLIGKVTLKIINVDKHKA